MPDLEVVEVDPNCFYSSDDSDDSSDSDDSDESDDINVVEVSEHTNQLFSQSFSYQEEPSKNVVVPIDPHQQPFIDDTFDVVTLNIDDNFLLDPEDEGTLFSSNELHQFDLATYIAGDSTSLLLSPPPALKRQIPVKAQTSSQKRLVSSTDFGTHGNGHDSTLCQPNAAQNTTKTTANNRRKRKNLTREFIDSSSDSEDDKQLKAVNVDNIEDDHNNKKPKKRKEDDPLWNPVENSKRKSCKKEVKTPNAAINKTVQAEIKQSNDEQKKLSINGALKPGNGLRIMLKKQLMSDRPIKKTNSIKVNANAENLKATPKANGVRVQPKIGLGRGKDIAITAKYYNCTESSDNSDRDKNDNIDKNVVESSTESDSGSDDDCRKSIRSTQSSKSNVSKPVSSNETVNIVKEKSREQIGNKNVTIDGKAKINPSTTVSNSLDATDFAKAIVASTKNVSKTKTSVAAKRSNLEKQKRLMQSTMLLQNPSKFKLDLNENAAPSPKTGGHGQPFKELKSISNQLPTMKSIKTKSVNDIKTEKSSEQQPKVESCKVIADLPSRETEDNLLSDDMEIDYTIGDHKIEPAKRKLNIQEYLKRKSLKLTPSNSHDSGNDLLENIKIEKTDIDKNGGDCKGKQQKEGTITDENNCSVLSEKSMYEEIIIVSMGCNTDVTIPEASFCQKADLHNITSTNATMLLSDIQSTLEKASSTAEISKISSCSLISSIQDVILKKTTTKASDSKVAKSAGDPKSSDDKEEEEEHGENKVIMHLRKDRKRPTTVTISIQTEPYFQFPPLKRLTPLAKRQPLSSEKLKRIGSIPRDDQPLHEATFRRSHVKQHERSNSRNHRNYRTHQNLSESSYYSDEDRQSPTSRRSRHSDFFESDSLRRRRDFHRRKPNRYSKSKFEKESNRNRTISRSLSQSSESSTTSADSSSTSQSSESSSSSDSDSSISSASSKSLNSYGGSSSKSYYGDEYKYSLPKSNQSYRSTSRLQRQRSSHRSNSPGKTASSFRSQLKKKILTSNVLYFQKKGVSCMLAASKIRRQRKSCAENSQFMVLSKMCPCTTKSKFLRYSLDAGPI